MVFFFSATGNSEWIARTASSRLGMSCVRITEATGTDYDVSGLFSFANRYVLGRADFAAQSAFRA